jgi:multidrug resistance protein, MATE family
MISFNTFPDGYKGMLKGMIKALELQKICAYLNIVSHWCINMTLMWYFGIHLGYKLKGLWCAKLTMEYTVWTFYSVLIYCTNWEKVAKKSKERHQYEMI